MNDLTRNSTDSAAGRQSPTEERRYVTRKPEIRQSEDGPTTLTGYAAVFDKDSEELGYWDPFVERIDRAAFDDCLADKPDVRCLFNHDPNIVLGRTKSETLTLTVDNIGLRYEAVLPASGVEMVAEAVKRGDVDQSSFAFSIRSQKWERVKDGPDRRTILEVEELYDVSPVTYPAYPDTTVAARSRAQQLDDGNAGQDPEDGKPSPEAAEVDRLKRLLKESADREKALLQRLQQLIEDD